VNQKRQYVSELQESAQIPIKTATLALDLNRSNWYYTPKKKEVKRSTRPLDPGLIDRLSKLSAYALTLGYRKTAAYLGSEFQVQFNHKKVYRHMNEMNLLQPKFIRRPKKKKAPAVTWYCPLKSDMRWEADLTLVPYESGYLYLFSVIDVFDKELVGSWFGFRCRKEDAIEALRQAVLHRFPEGKVPEGLTLTLRLDRGCQFTAHEFAKAARLFQIELEFCDVQAPNQKPFIESFFSNFKREEIYRNEYKNPTQALLAWPEYVQWYNHKRPHGSLNFLSPAQFRALQQNQATPGFNEILSSSNAICV
jgi:putative transposase